MTGVISLLRRSQYWFFAATHALYFGFFSEWSFHLQYSAFRRPIGIKPWQTFLGSMKRCCTMKDLHNTFCGIRRRSYITWTLVPDPSSCGLTPGVQAVGIAGQGNCRPIRRDMAEIGGMGIRPVFCHWLPVCTRLDSVNPAAHRLMASCGACRCSARVLGRNRVCLSNAARLIRDALLSTRLRGVAIDVHRGERDRERLGGFSIWGWPASSWALH